MARKMVAVNFTDGRTVDTILFDAAGDTEETVARLTDRMRENGWQPVKNSGRILLRDNGVLRPFTEQPRLHYGPRKVA